jgi:hypothetical protein
MNALPGRRRPLGGAAAHEFVATPAVCHKEIKATYEPVSPLPSAAASGALLVP